MDLDGIRRKNQALTDVHSGYVNVQSATGIPLGRLENKTEAFYGYEFGGNPWMPVATWKDIVEESFPGCDLFSLKEMAARGGYSDWRSFQHAVTSVKSAYHFFQDGPMWVTAPTSFNAGPAHVRNVMEERIRAGQERGFLNRWTIPSSGSVR